MIPGGFKTPDNPYQPLVFNLASHLFFEVAEAAEKYIAYMRYILGFNFTSICLEYWIWSSDLLDECPIWVLNDCAQVIVKSVERVDRLFINPGPWHDVSDQYAVNFCTIKL